METDAKFAHCEAAAKIDAGQVAGRDAAACSAGCPHCEQRVQPWLVAYIESWHGPRAQWTEEQRGWFYEMYAVLDSFARGFAFTPEPNGQSAGSAAQTTEEPNV